MCLLFVSAGFAIARRRRDNIRANGLAFVTAAIVLWNTISRVPDLLRDQNNGINAMPITIRRTREPARGLPGVACSGRT